MNFINGLSSNYIAQGGIDYAKTFWNGALGNNGLLILSAAVKIFKK
jgi:hypothetical protein